MRKPSIDLRFFGTITGVVIALSILFYVICVPVAIIIDVLFVAFIIFNIVLDRYCRKLIDSNNKKTEEFAKNKNYHVKYISLSDYKRLTEKEGLRIDDKLIVSKEEVKYI